MDSSVGKDVRISHIFHASGNAFIVALDHGILMGPIQGIENILEQVAVWTQTATGFGNCIIVSYFEGVGRVVRVIFQLH